MPPWSQWLWTKSPRALTPENSDFAVPWGLSVGVTEVLLLNLTVLTLQHIVNHPGFYFLQVEGVLVSLKGVLRFRLRSSW